MVNKPLKYTVIFGGGAIRGVAYLGALKALNEFDIENKCAREINVFNYDSVLDFILDSIGDF